MSCLVSEYKDEETEGGTSFHPQQETIFHDMQQHEQTLIHYMYEKLNDSTGQRGSTPQCMLSVPWRRLSIFVVDTQTSSLVR